MRSVVLGIVADLLHLPREGLQYYHDVHRVGGWIDGVMFALAIFVGVSLG